MSAKPETQEREELIRKLNREASTLFALGYETAPAMMREAAALLAADGQKLRVQEIPLSEEQRKMLSVTGDVSIPGADGKAGGEVDQRIGHVDVVDGRVRSYAFEQTEIATGSYSLFTRPQKAAQVAQPLTEEQISAAAERAGVYSDPAMSLLGVVTKFTRAIEQAHGIGKDQAS